LVKEIILYYDARSNKHKKKWNVTLSDHPSTSVQSYGNFNPCQPLIFFLTFALSQSACLLPDTTQKGQTSNWETENYSYMLREGNTGCENSNHTLKPHATLPRRPNSYACRHPALSVCNAMYSGQDTSSSRENFKQEGKSYGNSRKC